MINLVYCGDRKMVDGLTISLLSIIKHVSQPINVTVATAAVRPGDQVIKPTDLAPLTAKIKRVNHGHLRIVDLSQQFKRNYPKINEQNLFTPYCMLRLFIDQIPDLPSRVLYLDTDVVCRTDFTAFYEQDISKYELAGVLDYYGKWFFHHQLTLTGFDYLNSGVLLLNLEKIRQTGLLKRCRELCRVRKMFLPDQGALNRLAIYKKILPRRYNEQHRLHTNTVFQHFTTQFRFYPRIHTQTVKPWEVERMHQVLHLYDYDDILSQYLILKKEATVV